ncbi:uncharacterized protein T551_03200 [Pneumocystis jirovecii RU7]|uniref:CWF21 domain-containing protein n=1 Tax=Pneumocystis jirovecii (strain RU7) TaxID=1408657 RepID=A0A0W4ZFS1_PNEJ7|nr:uncharacterized protein T551_03200 [Pneumocystis jirovecii RU7]KTW27206.1 hypothetical protein T551_03200 [Pneumocystis jirovecii RU7]
MKSSSIGLPTPRGSGTNGYIMRNLSHIKHAREPIKPYTPTRHVSKKPDKDILEHDRKRKIEIKVFKYRDELEDSGELCEEDIEKKVDEYRKKLLDQEKDEIVTYKDVKNLKSYQVHELATAKARELEKLRKAFEIREDYEEGDAFKRMNEKSAILK